MYVDLINDCFGYCLERLEIAAVKQERKITGPSVYTSRALQMYS
jgi:hypothetical protein